ncbi:Eco57I restriction-modification methylase domain-containing protein [Dolichospermum sp. UHCC 0259]|uniref:Eco57I restriction-modification methylase domain-containing protein n=1 Tax=Dolichospermum sp. UHCC 0259 TaxID=2590010 RepID=UPI0014471BCD|nr:Eco57I restriction-modification methylase domain-containing protein [Dolichospermum sp. UHCC 0259]MTJ46795.1 hypothetical protein [Dolichospermum sp. UHCC 0259]
MKKQQIENLFTQRYNQAKWKQFLGQAFANVQLLSTPENLTGIDDHVATNAQKLGYILLDENGIDRQIAVYEVTLAQGIILERNRVGLRNLLRKYWKSIDAALIVYHHPQDTNWRFTYVSELTGYDADGEFIEIKTEPKRYTYILGEGESVKTAIERFERIINKGNKVSLDDVKEAFSVEKLSKTFFEEYKKHYDIFCKYMVSQPGIYQTIFNGDEKAIRDFNKKLLGRIVFLYFIQKKGWLGVPENEDWGTGNHKFLTEQFNKFTHKDNFYPEFLSVLFFDTLNTKRANDLIELVKNQPCRIPYLNGGLFEEDHKNHRNLIFPDHLFANLFNFFDQYNFTIYEDDPNDHTIAVDPEMLGHIFENLLEDNKDKGAYYTPKEIVHYMCQESLIEYLNTYCLNYDFSDLGITLIEETQKELITQFIKKKEININILEKSSKSKESYKSWFRHLNIALDNVKICDPAIGSGAFPMGLLHEIFTAKQTLHTFEFGNTTNFNASDVKLNIIQNSIYGVDIERGAVDIARLRFWLSLIVDEPEPQALPNLDYKIVVGNSLVSKFGDDIINIDWEIKDVTQGSILVDVYQPQEILRKISDKQMQFFSPDSDKKKLAADIRDLKIDLLISQLQLMIKTKGMENKPTGTGKTLTKNTEIYLQTVGWKQNIKELKQLKNNPDKSLNFFDWKLDFPEVMNPPGGENVGFDIVIGNPPYVDSENMINQNPNLRDSIKNKYKTAQGNWDLFVVFIELGLLLNSNNGVFSFIIPNKVLSANYTLELRRLLTTKNILEIRDYSRLNIFKDANVYPVTMLIKSTKIKSNVKMTIMGTNEWIKSINLINEQIFYRDLLWDKYFFENEVVSILLKLSQNPIINERKSFQILGAATVNEAYLIKEKLRDIIQKDKCSKKLINTGTIDKWTSLWGKKKTQYIKGNYEFPTILDSEISEINTTRLLQAKSQKLIIAGMSCEIEAFLDINGEYLAGKSTTIIIDDLDNLKIYCAFLNSKSVSFYVKFNYHSLKMSGGYLNINKEIIGNIPLPTINHNIKDNIINVVDNLIFYKSQGKDTTALEQQIDNMVYKLYELTYEEVKIIDPENTLTEKEYADIKI